ncbi:MULTISPECIES: MFS transporter [unclassified Streptomyces]|uniref:MFS transporter n=1 Tax=unclassified Streptomyces TaxID=2593676 RepID=UPI000DC7AD5B|nr:MULTISPECIES: MFS transporter [unclassified Streptomyces]AWZ08597.1 MFS transporter [Streptomyces sp. ICC4]AWZ15327.1 MFS transporter [Streptomyces sp. ICC1]
MSTETTQSSPEGKNGPAQEERIDTPADTSSTSVTSPTGSPADRRRWLALAIVMTAAFMDLVDVTIVNIAIPRMREDLGASTSAIQWITAGYALAFAAGLITGGRLGDIYGRKRLFLIGIAGFTAASLLCGIAPNPDVLVASRILQGAMAAMMVPQVLAIIHVTFPPHERGKVFGMFGAVVGLGAVSGPMLGALLTEWNILGLEWRPIFLINLPVGIAGLVLGRKFISESKAPKALRLDLVGVVLATLALVMLIFPLTHGRENDWPLWGSLCMIASPLVFAAFIAYEKYKIRKDGSPLVELSLFKVKSFAGGIAVQLTFGLATGIFFLVWTLYMQMGLGWSALKAGSTGIPFSLAVSAAAGVSVGKLVPRFGRKVLQAGALVMAAGLLLYIWESDRFGMDIAPWQMAAPLILMGAGMGLIVAPLNDMVLSEVPREHAGSASGLINTTGQMGNALGLGLTSVVFFGVIDDDLVFGAPYVEGFHNALWWVSAVMVAIFAVMFILPRKTLPIEQREGGSEYAGDLAPEKVPAG